MLAAIVGGGLQGIEAVYLCQKAGWDVRLIDRKPRPPAAGLCDRFVQREIIHEEAPGKAFKGADLVIPALENMAALTALQKWTRILDVPFAFDLAAYTLSASKLRSNQLFEVQKISMPLPWPQCGFPVVAKPDTGSGSHGVRVFHHETDLAKYRTGTESAIVLQAFVPGPSYSIEVIGLPGRYRALQVTDLEMDRNHDCKRVLAPTTLLKTLISDFEKTALTLAEAVTLHGLMDVEAVLHENVLKVLEIDARLPSQTPTAVFWSRGINMIQLLGDLFMNGNPEIEENPIKENAVIYEHIAVVNSLLEVRGENVLSSAGSLRLKSDFFGADEAITDFRQGRERWVATLIFHDKDLESVRRKRDGTIRHIMRRLKLENYRDTAPFENGEGVRP